MQDIQEIFNRLQKTKKEQKKIKSIYRDSLANSTRYKEIIEEITILKAKKKEIEDAVKSEFSSEFNKLDGLKTDVESNKTLMSDIAINKLVKGEPIKIIDEHNNKYEPTFSVSFKKI